MAVGLAVPHKVCRKCGNSMRVHENVSAEKKTTSLPFTASCATCGSWFDTHAYSDPIPKEDVQAVQDTYGDKEWEGHL